LASRTNVICSGLPVAPLRVITRLVASADSIVPLTNIVFAVTTLGAVDFLVVCAKAANAIRSTKQVARAVILFISFFPSILDLKNGLCHFTHAGYRARVKPRLIRDYFLLIWMSDTARADRGPVTRQRRVSLPCARSRTEGAVRINRLPFPGALWTSKLFPERLFMRPPGGKPETLSVPVSEYGKRLQIHRLSHYAGRHALDWDRVLRFQLLDHLQDLFAWVEKLDQRHSHIYVLDGWVTVDHIPFGNQERDARLLGDRRKPILEKATRRQGQGNTREVQPERGECYGLYNPFQFAPANPAR
jgi:hypothetical protein